MTVIKGVDVFFDVAGGRRCTRVFELALHLDTGAHLVVLFGRLYGWDLSLSKGPSCLGATAFHEVPIGFLLGRRKICRRNGECKQTILFLKPAALPKRVGRI